MPVYLIDKIKPKNSGTFAMVEAEDVSVGEERLDDVLDNKETKMSTSSTMPTDYFAKNTQYYLGELTGTINKSFEDGSNGDMIYISFSTGSTAPTLTFSGNNFKGLENLVVGTNATYELIAMWNGKWLFVYKEYL